MDVENKLDDDFIFYLEFANSYLNNFEDKFEADHCRVCQDYRETNDLIGKSLIFLDMVV